MIPRSVGVHDGSFHADEVTACALLIVFGLVDKDRIVRTREPERLNECEYVCDVAGVYDPAKKRFDHHQSEYRGDLSSAGMVWLYLKEQGIVSPLLYTHLNHALILGVDAHDNGKMEPSVGVCTFSHVISQFVPVHYDVPSDIQTAHFYQAMEFVIGHLQRTIERFQYVTSCREKVEAAMQKGGECLFFDQAMPWLESFFDLGGNTHPALFVMMPSGEHWKLRGIPPCIEERMKVRLPLPEQWAGLLEEQLRAVSGIPGAIFCHKGRFISVWQTKEDAMKALEFVLSRRG